VASFGGEIHFYIRVQEDVYKRQRENYSVYRGDEQKQ